MSASVENAIKIDGIKFPAGGDRRDIFVQSGDQSDMTRTRLGGYSGMRDAKCTMF